MTRTFAASSAPLIADFPGRADIEVEVPVASDQATAFGALTRWTDQGRWMLGSRIWVSRGDGTGVGDELSCWTGFGRIGFLDTMTITHYSDEWVFVEHTGRVVRGAGWMGVPRDGNGVRFVWGEAVQVPLGALGRVGWVVVAPLLRWGVVRSLRKLARLVEAGELR